MAAAEASLKTLFGVDFVMGECSNVEHTIIFARLREVAKLYQDTYTQLFELKEKYKDPYVMPSSIEDALKDHEATKELVEKMKGYYKQWAEMQATASKTGFTVPDDIMKY